MLPTDPRWTLIYEDGCGFCRTSLALVLGADRRRRLRPVALGTTEADELLADLTPDQREASWHLIAPDGRRESAGAAGPPLLRLLPGGKRPAAVLARFPDQTQRVYEWVADHRPTFSRLLPSAAKERAGGVIDRRAGEPG